MFIADVHEFVWRIPSLLSPGAVATDCGCGRGQNAIFLAEQGFSVVAFDRDPGLIDELIPLARSRPLDLSFRVGNLRDWVFEGLSDAMVVSRVLHNLEQETAVSAIERVKAATRPGGVNAVIALGDAGSFLDEEPRYANTFFFPSLPALTRCYTDWRILGRKERTIRLFQRDPHGTRYRHREVAVLAQRPSVSVGSSGVGFSLSRFEG